MASNTATLKSNGAVRRDQIPILYEDEGQEDMGETNVHTCAEEILSVGYSVFVMENHPDLQVFSNLNMYYPAPDKGKRKGRPYVSADIMIVHPPTPLPHNISSYTIDRDGPAPLLTTEILSEGTAKQDLEKKPVIYATLGVREYILVDITGEFLPERLRLKRLQPDGSWKDEQDPDGGVTSELGLRIVLDVDGQVRLMDARTREMYLRPREAVRRVSEEELRRLRQQPDTEPSR